jgi:hypothetical protein
MPLPPMMATIKETVKEAKARKAISKAMVRARPHFLRTGFRKASRVGLPLSQEKRFAMHSTWELAILQAQSVNVALMCAQLATKDMLMLTAPRKTDRSHSCSPQMPMNSELIQKALMNH